MRLWESLTVREIADPFVVPEPAGTSMRTRLRVTDTEHDLVVEVGGFLGSLRMRDLKRLCAQKALPAGSMTAAQSKAATAQRKRDLTEQTSSRIAGSIIRANNAEWSLSYRNLLRHRDTLTAQVQTLRNRVALAPGERLKGWRGYRSEPERRQKRRRMQILAARLDGARRCIAEQSPSICVGGKQRARRRHSLGDAKTSRADWKADWKASRRFLDFNGETGKAFGNDTLRVDPDTGTVEFNLPAAFAGRANTDGRRLRLFRFAEPAVFSDRHPAYAQWAARAADKKSMRYKLTYEPQAKRGAGAWYLDVSWATAAAGVADLCELRRRPTLAVDLNAGWIAAVVVDPDGNPAGRPVTIDIPQRGSTRRRLGQLRAAMKTLIDHAEQHRCASLTIEDLGFSDARDTGRETMGSGPKGKRFRRQVSNIPTAVFRDTAASMASHRGVALIAADPAYTSKWASQHNWREPINCSTDHPCSTHHGAAVVIGRRGLGLAARRSQPQQSMGKCSCPDRLTADKSKRDQRPNPNRCSRKQPRRTSPQSHTATQTGHARQGNARQRNATPFGVAQRSPPATPAGAAAGV